ncbi:hypothetical protein AAFF_G00430530 [Aldrovandia affinis]|uniref:Uncharacterized protein n=1 Tax=Aldrovandia affinis TaxID=143900 RepID=A0AAD7S934_9TELE|nr:hypothetical protein AAFF_G00430530 [Aldrovandia affinis]
MAISADHEPPVVHQEGESGQIRPNQLCLMWRRCLNQQLSLPWLHQSSSFKKCNQEVKGKQNRSEGRSPQTDARLRQHSPGSDIGQSHPVDDCTRPHAGVDHAGSNSKPFS